jgi:hypothetical protein
MLSCPHAKGSLKTVLNVVLASLKLAALVFRLPLALADGVFNRLKPLQRF